MKEVRFSHLTRVRLASIKKFFHYLQEGLPGKLCQIHVVNVVSFFDRIISMIKPFMRAEIFKCVSTKHHEIQTNSLGLFYILIQLYTYQSDMNLEEFQSKFVPKESLPKELGGDLPTIAEMHAAFRKELSTLSDYFKAEERQRDVANGLDKPKTTMAPMIHHFGQLDID